MRTFQKPKKNEKRCLITIKNRGKITRWYMVPYEEQEDYEKKEEVEEKEKKGGIEGVRLRKKAARAEIKAERKAFKEKIKAERKAFKERMARKISFKERLAELEAENTEKELGENCIVSFQRGSVK